MGRGAAKYGKEALDETERKEKKNGTENCL